MSKSERSTIKSDPPPGEDGNQRKKELFKWVMNYSEYTAIRLNYEINSLTNTLLVKLVSTARPLKRASSNWSDKAWIWI